jgi:hypothetical protein
LSPTEVRPPLELLPDPEAEDGDDTADRAQREPGDQPSHESGRTDLRVAVDPDRLPDASQRYEAGHETERPSERHDAYDQRAEGSENLGGIRHQASG